METKNEQSFLIADTSGLISLTSIADSNYDRATQSSKKLKKERTTIIIPYDVYAETINMIGKKEGHAKAFDVARIISLDDSFMIVDSSPAARQVALERFSPIPQSVSYTDCVVMAVADEYHTKQIFGFDEAFKKNGYSIIDERKS